MPSNCDRGCADGPPPGDHFLMLEFYTSPNLMQRIKVTRALLGAGFKVPEVSTDPHNFIDPRAVEVWRVFLSDQDDSIEYALMVYVIVGSDDIRHKRDPLTDDRYAPFWNYALPVH